MQVEADVDQKHRHIEQARSHIDDLKVQTARVSALSYTAAPPATHCPVCPYSIHMGLIVCDLLHLARDRLKLPVPTVAWSAAMPMRQLRRTHWLSWNESRRYGIRSTGPYTEMTFLLSIRFSHEPTGACGRTPVRTRAVGE